jgi:ribosomal protein S18 acetylase RimI-like enzyme
MQVRPYTGLADYEKLIAFTTHMNARPGTCAGAHTGDITHAIINGLRKFNRAEVIHLIEDAQGALLGYVLFYPKYNGVDLRVSDPALIPALLDWIDAYFQGWAAAHGRSTAFTIDPMDCETVLIAELERRGFVREADVLIRNERTLDDPIPDLALPDGFTIRAACGAAEAGPLAAVHHAAFNSAWTEAEYRVLTESTGYVAENEWVVVAPDATFAAFCIIWADPVNKTGLFEPVGADARFRRRGLTRALMYAGMRRLKTLGIETAIIMFEDENVAAKSLYHSIGFRETNRLRRYQKT